MKHLFQIFFLASCVLCLASCVEWAHDPLSSKSSTPTKSDDEQADSIRIRVAEFNAGSSLECTPDRVAKILFPYNFEIICFNEIPQGDWIDRVGAILGMDYSYVGKVSSANKKDKYKGILSRYKLENTNEYILSSKGWSPASIITGGIEKNSNRFVIYCLQIAGSSGDKDSYANMIAGNIVQRIKDTRAIVAGDFGNIPKDTAMRLFDDNEMNNIWNDLNIDISKESTYYPGKDSKQGIYDHILYSRQAHSHTLKGGFIEVDPHFAEHKIVWSILEFPPPRVKKKRFE